MVAVWQCSRERVAGRVVSSRRAGRRQDDGRRRGREGRTSRRADARKNRTNAGAASLSSLHCQLRPHSFGVMAQHFSTSEKRKAESCVFCASTAWQIAGTLVMSAMDQIFLDAHRGDFAAHARMMALIGSASSSLSFILQPLVGSLIDIHGRKPLMLTAGALQVVLKGLTALVPPAARVPVIVAQWLIAFVTYDGFMFARDAAIGDLWGDEPKELGRALSRLQTIRPVSSIISPLVGGYLTARSVRLPYALAALLYGGAALIAAGMPETLVAGGKRKVGEITLLSASPLNALKLFTSGQRLRKIALLQLITSVGDATRSVISCCFSASPSLTRCVVCPVVTLLL